MNVIVKETMGRQQGWASPVSAPREEAILRSGYLDVVDVPTGLVLYEV
jgi:hypothetical protein